MKLQKIFLYGKGEYNDPGTREMRDMSALVGWRDIPSEPKEGWFFVGFGEDWGLFLPMKGKWVGYHYDSHSLGGRGGWTEDIRCQSKYPCDFWILYIDGEIRGLSGDYPDSLIPATCISVDNLWVSLPNWREQIKELFPWFGV